MIQFERSLDVNIPNGNYCGSNLRFLGVKHADWHYLWLILEKSLAVIVPNGTPCCSYLRDPWLSVYRLAFLTESSRRETEK